MTKFVIEVLVVSTPLLKRTLHRQTFKLKKFNFPAFSRVLHLEKF